ncbi:hypothetical protein [Paraburkholderia sp. HD33-4]|uniref:hypothetical protein n=1 Tax=Paraburkholderia sp. HD33-4 TaxID=2883242 RepID=UPI001F48C320|nr:hypothetical protein [Paraburkholderia sp. HD33-4]
MKNAVKWAHQHRWAQPLRDHFRRNGCGRRVMPDFPSITAEEKKHAVATSDANSGATASLHSGDVKERRPAALWTSY